MIRFIFSLSATLALAACHSNAAPPSIIVKDGWARATVAGQSSGAIYATIANKGGPDRLIGASIDRAGMAMIHTNDMSGGIARMRMADAVSIPADATVKLAPSGTHVMLTGLKQPLAVGDRMTLTLRFDKAGAKQVPVAIVEPGSR